MTDDKVFLVVETVDLFRWVGVVQSRKDALRALVGIRRAPAAGRTPIIPIEWLPETSDRAICDFPHFISTLKCVSRRARHRLDDLFTPNGEWIALEGLGGEYSAFHCLREVECMDVCAVEREKQNAPEFSLHSARYAPMLRRDLLQPYHVFRVPQSVNKFFVSSTFAQRYEQHGLTGLDFLPVPLS